ncbi:NACHT, LRR and PYD domains-containing protein 12 isoform X3 [Xyrauchen texanus]|uniref:NACHT, LRR and PYD domains-containing protein 12 isoform X2 n=1 Tax=Xyrauchen texanus TaxID=154827 RepID=UPI002241D289|nr:NACHT, LRR and PYD domains-containing protein 12 isoform X2 [Xyrauchen texanus]XP_052002992.1 NACHT, LRR and PYD domains-containing protein 12 isoform X3 [Xyrauchen texanus]
MSVSGNQDDPSAPKSSPEDILSKLTIQERPDSPKPSHMSLKSDRSIPEPMNFSDELKGDGTKRNIQNTSDSPTTSHVSLKSARSIPEPMNFSDELKGDGTKRNIQNTSDSPTTSHVSLKSARSIPEPMNFCDGVQKVIKRNKQERSDSSTTSHVSLKSARSIPEPLNFSDEAQIITKRKLSTQESSEQAGCIPANRVCQQHHRALEVFCKTDNIYICNICVVQDHRGHSKIYSVKPNVPSIQSLLLQIMGKMGKEDFKTFKRELNEEYPECLGSHTEQLSASEVVEILAESFEGEAALRITTHFLSNGNPLQKITDANKSTLRHKCQHLNEGNSSQGKQSLLNEIYTDLFLTEGGCGEINNEHEVLRNEVISQSRTTPETKYACNDIFKTLPGQRQHVRTVLTMGIVGIGKNVSVRKFILDWADGKANQDINVIVHLPFRDLNQKKGNCSLLQLIQQYAPELKEANLSELKVLFILDGLEVCQYPLDFQKNDICSDINEQTSVDVLLTNLIKGNLLPSALLWITSRPSTSTRIPPECVHRVTEIRGFNDLQKEEYFRRKISDQKLASEIITHIKSCRSLYIMCHMPIFCWISATVLENMLSDGNSDEIPKTLTEMFTHFLLIQISLKHKKFNGADESNPKKLTESDKTLIIKLGEMAFQQLEKGNCTFLEEELVNCGIDVKKVSEYSVCTVIFREEQGLYREKVYSFVHLIFQEYLAAVYAHFACLNNGENVLDKNPNKLYLSDVHQSAVDKALRSENGHLDLFVRFLLGLSVDPNHTLLQDFSKGDLSQHCVDKSKIVHYIKDKIKQELTAERIINLFSCLNELKDNSLVKEIQTAMKSGTLLGSELEPEQWSALAYLLLASGEELDEFDMKKFHTSTANQLRLLPVLRICRKARLDCCNLSQESCRRVASAVQLNSPLRELDLSNSKLDKYGVSILLSGLTSPHCQVQKLGLNSCNFSSDSCKSLTSVLMSTNSPLRELDLSYNELTDNGVKSLCSGLISPHCKVLTLKLKWCGLTNSCCEDLASVLKSSSLRELELKNNDLKDIGVKKLSTGLKDPQCSIEKLGLSGCMISEVGFSSLVSALSSNTGHLRELDLSYNHPGDSEMKLLSAKKEDPNCKLEKLDFSNGGKCRMKPGLRKYGCQLTVDEDLLHRRLILSDGKRKVSESRVEQPYPDNPDRYKLYPQAMCKEPLTGRCYFEVKIEGAVGLGVAYKSADRTERIMGINNKFPSLHCLNGKLKLWQNNYMVCEFPICVRSKSVGVYLDWESGSLSYYSICNKTSIHLHTLHTTFTGPLYAGYFFLPDSSVTLCPLS